MTTGDDSSTIVVYINLEICFMSVREKLVSELLLLGRDGHEIAAIIESQFSDASENHDRVRLARDILTNTGLSAAQLAKLVPLLTRFVLEYAEISQTAAPQQDTQIVNNLQDAPSVSDQVRRKKPRKKVLSGKDLQELFDIRAPSMIQKYSDDEGAPKPVIIKVNKPSIIVAPKASTLSSARPTRPVVEKPSAWDERPAIVPSTHIDYGGFW
jgi:hypothetical protein